MDFNQSRVGRFFTAMAQLTQSQKPSLKTWGMPEQSQSVLYVLNVVILSPDSTAGLEPPPRRFPGPSPGCNPQPHLRGSPGGCCQAGAELAR
jgi:hypothetical protein